jgi:glycosyltransferase involved in cell wall biosynthesis
MPVRISVVIPSYNHRRYVVEAVRSALDSRVDGLEVIVVDDGSTDGSVDSLAELVDSRLRIVRQENRGAHDAINRGIAESRGEYLAVLNSDDRYVPERLPLALGILSQDPGLALFGSHIRLIDEDGGELSVKHGFDDLDPWPIDRPAETFKSDRDLRTALLLQNYWATTSNFVMPRGTFNRYGPFRPLRYCHDWDFALRVLLRERATLLESPLVEYRVHGGNTIRENMAAMVYEICWTLAVHAPRYLTAAGFWTPGREQRSLQLLRSIYVYGCDRVFWNLTAQIAFGPPGSEDALLDPGDPVRALCLAEVEKLLAAQQPTLAPSILHRVLKRVMR